MTMSTVLPSSGSNIRVASSRFSQISAISELSDIKTNKHTRQEQSRSLRVATSSATMRKIRWTVYLYLYYNLWINITRKFARPP